MSCPVVRKLTKEDKMFQVLDCIFRVSSWFFWQLSCRTLELEI